jgi:hypothetical protein
MLWNSLTPPIIANCSEVTSFQRRHPYFLGHGGFQRSILTHYFVEYLANLNAFTSAWLSGGARHPSLGLAGTVNNVYNPYRQWTSNSGKTLLGGGNNNGDFFMEMV